jgi:hypothetical protein
MVLAGGRIMKRSVLVVFYKDGTHAQEEADNTSINLKDPANQAIERIFIANTPSDANIAISMWGNEFQAKPRGKDSGEEYIK